MSECTVSCQQSNSSKNGTIFFLYVFFSEDKIRKIKLDSKSYETLQEKIWKAIVRLTKTTGHRVSQIS